MNNHPSNTNDPHDVEKKVERALNSLSGLQHAKTDTFFFARLEAKMNRSDEPSFFRFFRSWTVPVQATFYTVLLLAALNTVSIIYYSSSDDSELTELEAFADEYGLYTAEELYESLLEE